MHVEFGDLERVESRDFNGVCVRFAEGARGTEFTSYEALLVPRLWLLGQNADCRCYRDVSVVDIVRSVLGEWGIEQRWHTTGSYYPRPYWLQYCESQLGFVRRLLEDAGISFHFGHEDGGHQVHLTDGPSGFRPLSPREELEWVELEEQARDLAAIWDWKGAENVRPTGFVHHDFNFTRPQLDRLEGTDLRPTQGGLPDRRLYEYPGGFENPGHGYRLAGLRLDEAVQEKRVFEGRSNVRFLSPGKVFTLTGHFGSDGRYLVTSVVHEARGATDYRSGGGAPPSYGNRFTCVPDETPIRPPRITPRPRIWGLQTAIVTQGADGSPDGYGRVKVKFHWGGHELESYWIRVASPWAGQGWGAIHLPRCGQEVVLSFLDGDPEQPIVVGSVYNARETVPYTLPAHKTRAGFKSKSFSAKTGNEILLEDKGGEELLLLHAEKDFNLTVRNDADVTVKGKRRVLVAKDSHETVLGKRAEKVSGDLHVTVDGRHDEKTALAYALSAGTTVHVAGGTSVVVEAGAQLTLKVGSSSVDISPAGVAIQGPLIRLNSGGSAGSGSGASPSAPEPPQAWSPSPGGGTLVQVTSSAPPPQIGPKGAVPKDPEKKGVKVLPSVFEAKKKPPPPIPKAKGTPSVVGAKKKPPPPKPKKRSVTTGLGLAVDFLVELSPTLKSNIEALQKAGWTFELKADVGSYCSVDEKKIVCDIAYKGDEKKLVQALAHESGHALYKMDPYVSPTGKTKDQYVEANVKRELKDEGEATLMNCQIRDELLKHGVDIGVAGVSRDEYVKAYEACKDPSDPKQREKLRIQIGETFRHGEKPSGEGGIDYGEYYAKPWAKYWDDHVAPKLKPPKRGGP